MGTISENPPDELHAEQLMGWSNFALRIPPAAAGHR